MSDEGLQASVKKELVADSLSEAERKDVDDFCASIQIEEMSLDQWSRFHSDIDLQVPVYVTAAQLAESQKIVVRLSRTIRTTNSSCGRAEKREKFEYKLDLKPSFRDSSVIVVKGQGDRFDERVGNLVVIVRVKD